MAGVLASQEGAGLRADATCHERPELRLLLLQTINYAPSTQQIMPHSIHHRTAQAFSRLIAGLSTLFILLSIWGTKALSVSRLPQREAASHW